MNAVTNHSSLPRISVVLCTFNGARYLREQLDSIAQQTRLPDELVVCDDGSTDETLKILSEFTAESKFPVRVTQNVKRLGSTRNFDQAISLAGGELIALCDQDDRWRPQKLEKLSDVLVANPFIGGVFSDAELIDENSKPVGMRLFKKHKFSTAKQRSFLSDPASMLLKHDVITGSTLMFRAALRKHCQPIPASWVHDGWLAWIISLQSRIALVAEPLIDYRIHAGQQLGVAHARARGAKGETRRQHYARVARQFGDLLNHLVERGWKKEDRLLVKIREKIVFLTLQAKLSSSFAMRVLQMGRLLPRYVQYARGLGSLRKDILLGREMQ